MDAALVPDAFTHNDAAAYITQVRWQFARSMPQWPHEYTLRKWRPDLDDQFRAFVALIRQTGVIRPWPYGSAKPKYRHTYLALGRWEYWTMGAPIDARGCERHLDAVDGHVGGDKGCTILINRAHVEPVEQTALPLVQDDARGPGGRARVVRRSGGS